jgi:predicted Ser/Thr protein kinase
MSRDLSGVYQTELVVPQRNGAVTNEAEMMTEVTNNSLGAAQQRVRKHRRMANQIIKEYKCMYCEKFYGSSAAAIMHMRKKHKEGTK